MTPEDELKEFRQMVQRLTEENAALKREAARDSELPSWQIQTTAQAASTLAADEEHA